MIHKIVAVVQVHADPCADANNPGCRLFGRHGLGGVYAVGKARINGTKMLEVPGVDYFRSRLKGTTKEEGVVNAATRKTGLGGLRDGPIIFILIQGYDCASVANLLDEQ
jgi:hypothetical protein